ncbi:hypothetical protein [Kribbella sp.]|nr:hypothetical protein [Kribbella sp.]HZX05557.1 hypothetical protein [Kribbella sp.]
MWSSSPGSHGDHRCPLLGEHTDGVLVGLGYGGAAIAAMRSAKVVA